MNRRNFLKTGAAGVTTGALAGCTQYIPFIGSDGSDGGDGDGNSNDSQNETQEPQEQPQSDPQTNESNETNETDSAEGNETEDEYAEASDPESNPENAPNESEYASKEDVQASQVTDSDVSVTEATVERASTGTQVTGILTNESGSTISTIELIATFTLTDGSQATAQWGTNDLGDGEEWDFTIPAPEVEYATVEKCHLDPEFPQS